MKNSFIHAIPVGSIIISSEDTISAANDPFLEIFPKLRLGRSYLTVLRQPDVVTLVNHIRADVKSDGVEVTLKGETERSFKVSGAKLGEGSVLICLQDMNETALAIQARQNFVADLGHELKTPLTAISGILETCEDDPDAIAHFLPIMTSEVERMKNLVTDLLILSQVESNERRAPRQKTVLQQLVNEASTALTVLADQTGARIEISMPEEPIQFRADPDEITRAIRNLVENAIRYGKPGGVVRIKGELLPFTKGTQNVSITVSDDGPGVQAHHIPRLTERFYRVDSHRSRDSGGSGLGLAIVKHIVNHHRGRMAFKSSPGNGTDVTLLFPTGSTT